MAKSEQEYKEEQAGLEEEKNNLKRLEDRTEAEKESIKKSEIHLESILKKKDEILEAQKKELNQEVEKVETFRKDLQEKLR